MYNIELWASSLLNYATEGRHKIATPLIQALSLLENQVGDLLPTLALSHQTSLANRGISSIADLTECDWHGRHWHPNVYAWPLLEHGSRGREIPQEPHQLAGGQTRQSFSLNTDGTRQGAYAI